MAAPLPSGIRVIRLQNDTPRHVREGARAFCLRMINEVYGYSYRPDWHGDLDTLPEQDSPYFPEQRGAFFVLLNAEDDIIGTAGLRALSSRPDIVALTKGRFPNPDSAASHWRMYVDSRYRRMGVGRVLIDLRREAGTEMGYDSIYNDLLQLPF